MLIYLSETNYQIKNVIIAESLSHSHLIISER